MQTAGKIHMFKQYPEKLSLQPVLSEYRQVSNQTFASKILEKSGSGTVRTTHGYDSASSFTAISIPAIP